MKQRWNAKCRLGLAVLIALAGCSRAATTAEDKSVVDYKLTSVMANLYNGYLGEHSGQPPKDEQPFRQFLQTKEEILTKSGLTVDKMFVSPRNGKPFNWVYGRPLAASTIGITMIGYEAEPSDGQRMILGGRGEYQLVDEAKFHAAYPNAK
jgi:hypothetical protein